MTRINEELKEGRESVCVIIPSWGFVSYGYDDIQVDN